MNETTGERRFRLSSVAHWRIGLASIFARGRSEVHFGRRRTLGFVALSKSATILIGCALGGCIALAVLPCDGRAYLLQQQTTNFRFPLGDASIADELHTACPLERTLLSVTELASNPGHSPQKARRVADGWLVYDRYDRQVIELSADLQVVARWGKVGEGPMEYRAGRGGPPGFGRTEAGETFVVDDGPPSIMALGLHRNEYQLERGQGTPNFLDDAINVNDRILMAGDREGIFEGTLGERSLAVRWSLEDMGIVVGEDGQSPSFLLRRGRDGKLYAGASNQSAIWTLDDGPSPRKVLQRCLPTGLMNIFTDAPRMQGGVIDGWRYSITTMVDFLVLRTGHVLTLGALDVGADLQRSIEMYDDSGTLVRAWTLPLKGRVRGAFDPQDPRRILIWDGDDEEHVRLIEVDGEGYPSS